MENKKIIIGLGTFERPKMLKKCLLSLNEVKQPNDIDILLLVADNSTKNPSISVLEEVKKTFSYNLSYLIVKEKGIVKMRNAILDFAKSESTDYLVFLDDDELVEKNWLVELFQFLIDKKADAVSGMVVRKLPSNTPNWLINAGFFNKVGGYTGKVLNSASTSNVIIDFKKFTNEWNLRFDERLNFFGSSDNLFFKQAYHKGAKILKNNNAKVTEIFPESRSNEGWLLQRKFRKGVTQIKRENILYGKTLSFLNGFITIIAQYSKFLKYLIISSVTSNYEKKREKKLHAQLALQYYKGLLNGMFSKKPFEEYKQKHGY